MFRFLLKPRWIALGLFALAMSALCVRLAFWQLDRLHGRRHFNALYAQGMQASPVPLEALLARTDGSPLLYRRATVTGTYDTDREVILYGRTQDDRPGNHVITPLMLPDGRAVIVDRGWVPFQMDTPPVIGAAPPEGPVQVTGLVFGSEAGGGDAGPVTTVKSVDLGQLGDQLPYPLLRVYLQLQTQAPAQPSDLPVPPPPPALDDGPHLSYALQWFAFATIAFGGFWLLAIRQIREERGATAT